MFLILDFNIFFVSFLLCISKNGFIAIDEFLEELVGCQLTAFYIAYLHSEIHITSSKGSLIIAITLKAKYRFHAAICYVLYFTKLVPQQKLHYVSI
jgi:hypothetical protein